jgi:hypothetical protein
VASSSSLLAADAPAAAQRAELVVAYQPLQHRLPVLEEAVAHGHARLQVLRLDDGRPDPSIALSAWLDALRACV